MRVFFLTVFFSLSALAQVGVNTSSPGATLDVVGAPSSAAVLDGLVLPNVTGNTLTGTTYTTNQTGDLLYVTAKPTSSNTQTKYLQMPAPSYFDGTTWYGLMPSTGGQIKSFGDIGCCTVASLTVNGELVSASKTQFVTWFDDLVITHNLNLSKYYVSVTYASTSTGNNYTQLKLDGDSAYTPIFHELGANSFKLLLEDYPGTVQTLELYIDITTGD